MGLLHASEYVLTIVGSAIFININWMVCVRAGGEILPPSSHVGPSSELWLFIQCMKVRHVENISKKSWGKELS